MRKKEIFCRHDNFNRYKLKYTADPMVTCIKYAYNPYFNIDKCFLNKILNVNF